jgi:hypothetical protein
MSIEYICGLLVGVIVGVIVFILLKRYTVRGTGVKAAYDERQELLRGRAYQYAFFSMCGWYCLQGILLLAGIHLMDELTGNFMGFLIGTGVFGITCVLTDAYFVPNQKQKPYLILLSIIALMNGFTAISCWLDGSLLKNHLLSAPGSISLVLFLELVTIAICLILHRTSDGEEE